MDPMSEKFNNRFFPHSRGLLVRIFQISRRKDPVFSRKMEFEIFIKSGSDFFFRNRDHSMNLVFLCRPIYKTINWFTD